MTAFEIFEYVVQLLRRSLGIEPKNPVDDVVGSGLVGWVEVSGLSRRFEGPDDDPARIRAQIQVLAVQYLGVEQGVPLALFEVRSSDRRCVLI